MATICVRFPFIAACIPKEWLTPEGATFSNFDLTEWEEIEHPDESSKEASSDFRANNVSHSDYHSKHFSSAIGGGDEDDGGGGRDDLSETISLTQMLDELNKHHTRKCGT